MLVSKEFSFQKAAVRLEHSPNLVKLRLYQPYHLIHVLAKKTAQGYCIIWIICMSRGSPCIHGKIHWGNQPINVRTSMYSKVAKVGSILCPLERTGYDSRVGENVNGKSTLRLYLQANRMAVWKGNIARFDDSAYHPSCSKRMLKQMKIGIPYKLAHFLSHSCREKLCEKSTFLHPLLQQKKKSSKGGTLQIKFYTRTVLPDHMWNEMSGYFLWHRRWWEQSCWLWRTGRQMGF